MSRTIDSQQSPLRYRSELVRIDLVHLITYTDRDNDTPDEHFYFARQPVLFDWGNNGTDIDFWPVLKSIGPLSTSVNHIPSAGDSELMRKPWSFVLSNEPYGVSAERLINTLRDGHILENARVEWTQILLADRPTTVRIDLTTLAGDEHTFWYRGRVRRVGPITNDSISFECEMDVPEIRWLRGADTAETDPDHIGVRVAKVAGEAKKVACVNWDVGAISTLVSEIQIGYEGDWELTDASRFPSSGEASCGIERIEWTGKSGNTLTTVTRSVGTSAKTNHAAGDVVVELISTATFLVADHQVDAINALYALNPYNGLLTRIPVSLYTATVNDTTTVSGSTVASIAMTQEQLRLLMAALSAGASRQTVGSVTQNPVEIDWDGNLTMDGDGVENLPCLRDGFYDPGFDATVPPFCRITADGSYVWLRFTEPTYGYSTQNIKVVAAGASDTVKMRIYAGRYGLDGDASLITTHVVAYPGGGAIYATGAVDDVGHGGWITIYCENSGPDLGDLSLILCWRELTGTAEEVTAQHGDAATWSKHAGVPESTDNAHDDNLGTYCTLGTGEWVQASWPAVDENTYDVQRIHVALYGVDDGEEYQILVSGTSDNIFGKGHPPATYPQYVVRQGGGSIDGEWFEFETEMKGDDIRFYANVGVPGVSELKRDLVVYQDIDATIQVKGAGVGYGLRLFADVDGYEVPSGASPVYWTGSAGTLMKWPCDILRYLIEELGGEAVDTTAYDACYTNLGAGSGVEIAGDLRAMGLTLEEILARVAFESRVTLVPEETATGREWKMLTALSTYAYSAASGSVTEWDRGGFAEVGGALRDEVATRFVFHYAPNWTRGDGEEAYTAIVVANEDVNDLSVPSTADFQAAVNKYGNIDAEPVAFRMLRAVADAEEIAGYYCHELIRGARLFGISGVPWSEAFSFEAGDIINATPPWDSSALKCRIISYTKDPGTEQVELRLVEVE